jgi:hypothetical protein
MRDSKEDKKFFPIIPLKYTPSVFGFKMPVALVSFKSIPQPLQGLVDSGATNTLIGYDWALQAGIQIDKSKKLKGGAVGSGYDYYQSEPVEVEMAGQKYNVKFDVVLGDPLLWPCILGQDSIFRLAKVTFKRYKEEFCIQFRKDIN